MGISLEFKAQPFSQENKEFHIYSQEGVQIIVKKHLPSANNNNNTALINKMIW